MKKIAIVLLLVTLSFSIMSCSFFLPKDGGGEQPEDQEQEEEKGSTEKVISGKITTVINNDNGESRDVFGVSIKAVPNVGYETGYSSYRDENTWYYFFNLGRLYNVPLDAGEYNPFQGVETVLSFESSTTTSTSIQNFAEKITQNSSTVNNALSVEGTYNKGIDKGIEWKGLKSSEKSNLSVTGKVSLSKSESYSDSTKESTTKASQNANTSKQSVSYKFTADSPKGDYYYMLLGIVDVYEAVLYDVKTGEYFYDVLPIVYSSNRALVYVEDIYTLSQSASDTKLDFDLSVIESLTKPTKTIYQAKRYDIEMTPVNCNDNNGYNTADQCSNSVVRDEIDKHVVDVFLEGCYQGDSKFIVVDKDKFRLGFKVIQDVEDIALTQISGSGAYKAWISSDGYNGRVKDTSFNGEVKRGVYYYKVYYKDGSSDSGCSGNHFLNNMGVNDDFTLINSSYTFRDIDAIDRIEITCVYEIHVIFHGFMGFTGNTFSNWRCDKTLYFN